MGGGNRKRGDGSVYEYPKGSGKWIAAFPIGHGKYEKRRAESKKAAESELDALRKNHDEARRLGIDERGGKMTLNKFVEKEWWPTVAQRNLAPTTISDYKNTIEIYLAPMYGKKKLEEFTVQLVHEIFKKISNKHSIAMAHRVLTKLSMLLSAARRRRYITYNAVEDARAELPTVKRKEVTPLTLQQTRKLLEVAEDSKMSTFYHVALTLGLRFGELLGLQWGDIDWQEHTISIKRQVQEVSGKKQVREDTKTDAGERTLPIPPRLLARLGALYDARTTVSPFVLCTRDGKPLTPSVVSHHWRGGRTGKKRKDGTDVLLKGMRQKAGLSSDVTIHYFRHTVATRLMELKVQGEIRDKIMGHGKKGIRELYAHAMIESMREALELLEKTMWPEERKDEVGLK